MVGGAYGGFCDFDTHSGMFTYSSYRDPNLLKTVDVYDGAPLLCCLPACLPGAGASLPEHLFLDMLSSPALPPISASLLPTWLPPACLLPICRHRRLPAQPGDVRG